MVVKMQEALMSIGVKKGLPYTKFLNRELSELRGSGVLQNILAIPKLTCPLDEELIPITFSKIIFLFTIFVLGGTLSIIIFIIEQAFSKNRDATLEVNSSKQCKMIKGRIPKTNEIGVQCNIGQSAAIGTKNIMIR